MYIDMFSFNFFTLQRLKRQLEASQPKVMSLKDTADQYLVDVVSEACQSTREKINLIAKKNEELLRRCNDNLELLETTIDPSEFDISRVSVFPVLYRGRVLLGFLCSLFSLSSRQP